MNLANLKRKVAPLKVEFDREILNIKYRPHLYSDEDQRTLNRLKDKEDNTGLVDVFQRLFTEWDMREDDHEVPLNRDELLKLPPFLRSKIANAMIDDEVDRGNLKPSSSGSAPEETSALVRTGTPVSTTANGSEA